MICISEDTMKISDIKFEMEINGVDGADIALILELCKARGFESEILDEELVKKGYDKIFTVDYDMMDDYSDDDEYETVVKFPHKKHYNE
ncbi:MAG: hypothetical protein GW919_02515 [Epsilonproteobacteria bacterium]|nr:hypothetical protein [Campylobacterota bacterium]NCO29098.1 hypothetical protein [Campylobacterota bacterium]